MWKIHGTSGMKRWQLESGFLKEDFLETYAEQSLVESLSEFLKFAGTKKKKKKKKKQKEVLFLNPKSLL